MTPAGISPLLEFLTKLASCDEDLAIAVNTLSQITVLQRVLDVDCWNIPGNVLADIDSIRKASSEMKIFAIFNALPQGVFLSLQLQARWFVSKS